MIKYSWTLLLIFSCLLLPIEGSPTKKAVRDEWALVVGTVADGLGMAPELVTLSPKRFTGLPHSWRQVAEAPYTRLHQLLFNQRVRITEVRGIEARVELPYVCTKSGPNEPSKPLACWVLQKHLIPIKELKNLKVDLSKLPPILADDTSRPIAVLTEPHWVGKHKRLFSVGTRFTVKWKHDKTVTVNVFNPKTKSFDLIKLPKERVYLPQNHSRKERVATYVKLVRKWAKLRKGFIPYVLGGSSWTETYHAHDVDHRPMKAGGKQITRNGKPALAYFRKGGGDHPRSGMDCSSLISTAAQIAGMPYYSKNTTTIGNRLQKISKGDQIQAGDLILIRGHVFIISKTSPSLHIVQAQGYSGGIGEGRVSEAAANKLFAGIKTPKDLQEAFLNKKPLTLRHYGGEKNKIIKNWSIHKVRSCWKNQPPMEDPFIT